MCNREYISLIHCSVGKGDVVKVKADRSMLGLKGSTVEAIVDKAPEREESFD